jgi:Outer membrane protein and related peptidoglycan-associated (lipo)proteins
MKRLAIKQVFFLMLLLAFATSTQPTQAQVKEYQLKLATELNKADIAYQDSKFSLAAEHYESYLYGATSNLDDARTKLADCYWQMRVYNEAFRVYKIIYENGDAGASQEDRHRIAELYARFRQYDKAAKWLAGVEGYQSKATVYNSMEKLDLMKEDSLNWQLNFLNINTSYREFSPFWKDDILFFTSNKQLPLSKKAFAWDGNNFTHLWKVPVSGIKAVPELQLRDSTATDEVKQNDKKLAGVFPLGDVQPNKNAWRSTMQQYYTSANRNPAGSLVGGLAHFPFNTGNLVIDKYNHVYFSSNYPTYNKGVNRIGLVEGMYSPASGITKTHTLPLGDAKSYSVMHPAVNSEGTVIVFSSDKAGGKGGFDLYYAERETGDKPWGPMQTFQGPLNTVGNEVFPTITPTGYLYFSSDAWPGLGGLDIYRIPLQDALAGKGELEHLGYPINSEADDFGMTQDSTGTKGYFTSDRLNNDDNIYSFSYEFHKKIPKLFIQGMVKDEVSKEPVRNATVFLLNKKDNKVSITRTDLKGRYRFLITPASEVVIKAVEKEHSSNCFLMKLDVKPNLKDSAINLHDLLLGKYKTGYKWKLGTIHYDNNNFNIRENERSMLDNVLNLLNKYPIKIEIGVHTDSRGSTADNDRQSQHSANAAAFYLLDHGIDPGRVTAKGYGKRELINKCADGVPCTEQEHQMNRRTEVKITGLTNEAAKLEINPDRFKNGEQIDKSALPKGFFENCD